MNCSSVQLDSWRSTNDPSQSAAKCALSSEVKVAHPPPLLSWLVLCTDTADFITLLGELC